MAGSGSLRALGLALLLAGCGDEKAAVPPIPVRFSPATLRASFAQGSVTQPVSVAMTLARLPADTPLALVLEQGPEAAWDRVLVTGGAGPRVELALVPYCLLAPGTYEDVLTFHVCDDATCQVEYPLEAAGVPYVIEVTEGLVLGAWAGGAPIPGVLSACSTLPDHRGTTGQRLELRTTVPVAWRTAVATTFGVPAFADVAQTETSFAATLADVDPYRPATRPSGTAIGSMTVSASALGGAGGAGGEVTFRIRLAAP